MLVLNERIVFETTLHVIQWISFSRSAFRTSSSFQGVAHLDSIKSFHDSPAGLWWSRRAVFLIGNVAEGGQQRRLHQTESVWLRRCWLEAAWTWIYAAASLQSDDCGWKLNHSNVSGVGRTALPWRCLCKQSTTPSIWSRCTLHPFLWDNFNMNNNVWAEEKNPPFKENLQSVHTLSMWRPLVAPLGTADINSFIYPFFTSKLKNI